MKTISEEIAALRAMSVAELVERYVALFGRLPRCKQQTWLFRRCAWRLQEIRLGGLSELAKQRLEELVAQIDLPLDRERVVRRNGTALGTSVARVWRGREVRAVRVENGWECDGITYRSLSAVAKATTGSHWNGKLFFGLTRRAE